MSSVCTLAHSVCPIYAVAFERFMKPLRDSSGHYCHHPRVICAVVSPLCDLLCCITFVQFILLGRLGAIHSVILPSCDLFYCVAFVQFILLGLLRAI
jgi:hypothetical protein